MMDDVAMLSAIDLRNRTTLLPIRSNDAPIWPIGVISNFDISSIIF